MTAFSGTDFFSCHFEHFEFQLNNPNEMNAMICYKKLVCLLFM